MSKMTYYITTTLPYVNSDPHLGFALEIIQADCLARHAQLLGQEIFFNTGTDEHGLKIYRQATSFGVEPQSYVDDYAERFAGLKDKLDLVYTNFIRTTNPHHKQAAQKFWQICEANGDIYKRVYIIKYCVGCELEKTDSELVGGKCELHPNLDLEFINEENYFFRFSKYQQPLLNLYSSYPDLVIPRFRQEEIAKFVAVGLQDFSISRIKEKMPWGIPVPGDPSQVMYVWFDALINYISTLGWPENLADFEKFWGTLTKPQAVQVAGKDNLRQQSAMWQAMLMSAGLPPSRHILIHGFITSGGQKMSKSLGNVVDPINLAEKYGSDALRYYLIREITTFEDGDFTLERFEECYNAGLANGIGNLTSRILKMAQNADIIIEEHELNKLQSEDIFVSNNPEYNEYMQKFELKKAADYVWLKISGLDLFIQQHEPFKKIKNVETQDRAKKDIIFLLEELYRIARLMEPFLPKTAKKIRQAIISGRLESGLFPRV